LARYFIAFISFLLVGICSIPSYAQTELVPAEHEIYNFLKRLQIKGVLTERYSSSFLPYDRRAIAKLIDDIIEKRERLSRTEIDALERFKTEFSYELGLPREERISIINHGLTDVLSTRQKYLYRYEDENAVISSNIFLGGEYQYHDVGTITDKYTSLWQIGGGLSGTVNDWFGFSLYAVNGYVAGSRELGKQNIEVARSYKIDEPDSRFYDFTRGHIRAANDWGSVTIGRERLIGGNGTRRNTLLFSDYAPKIDYIGLNLQYNRFFFNFFHGWLLGEGKFIVPEEGVLTLHFPEKYLSFHRFGAFFFDARMQIAISELIVYGNRGVEIAYLNPFLFFKSVEHSLRDRDKAMLMIDMQIRPYKGLEIYGDLLVDDLAFDKLGTDWLGNQVAYRLGGYVIPPVRWFGNMTINLDYVRIRPYVYTHRIFFNSYEHAGYPIGHPLGPNSDAWTIRLNQMLTGRSRLELYISGTRKGHNITDENRKLVRNVGGDISQGYRSGDNEYAHFLDGNLEKTGMVGFLVTYEFLHQFYLLFGYEFQNREETWREQTFRDHFMFCKIVIAL
jgi:hypothetical protein